jgi:hypothetical protein
VGFQAPADTSSKKVSVPYIDVLCHRASLKFRCLARAKLPVATEIVLTDNCQRAELSVRGRLQRAWPVTGLLERPTASSLSRSAEDYRSWRITTAWSKRRF